MDWVQSQGWGAKAALSQNLTLTLTLTLSLTVTLTQSTQKISNPTKAPPTAFLRFHLERIHQIEEFKVRS